MPKVALILALLAITAAPAMAEGKKINGAKPKPAATSPAPVDMNEASLRLMREGLPLLLPSWAQVIYFSSQAPDPKDKK